MVTLGPDSVLRSSRGCARYLFAYGFGAVVVIVLSLSTGPTAAIAASGSCVAQSEPAPTRNAALGELERVIAGAAAPEGTEAFPEEHDVEEEVRKELGTQFGGEWYELEAGDFAAGLASGPITAQQAEERLDQVLAREVDSEHVSFAEEHTEIVPVPHSTAELEAIAASIRSELPASEASVGLTVKEPPGSKSPAWPQVDVKFEGDAAKDHCEAATSVLAKYGDEVTYSLRAGANGGGVGELPTEPPTQSGGTKGPAGMGTYLSAAARQGAEALRLIIRKLHQRSGHRYGTLRVPVRLTVPRPGRLVVKVWAISGDARKLAAVGSAPVRGGAIAIVVPVKRTAFGRRLRGRRLTGQLRLISQQGDVTLAS